MNEWMNEWMNDEPGIVYRVFGLQNVKIGFKKMVTRVLTFKTWKKGVWNTKKNPSCFSSPLGSMWMKVKPPHLLIFLYISLYFPKFPYISLYVPIFTYIMHLQLQPPPHKSANNPTHPSASRSRSPTTPRGEGSLVSENGWPMGGLGSDRWWVEVASVYFPLCYLPSFTCSPFA